MLRRLTTAVVSATSALVLAGAALAIASHDTPDRYDHPFIKGGNVTCEDLSLDFVDKIEYDGPQPTTVDVDPDDYPGVTITAVIVKAGNSSFVYTTPPFEHMTGPDGKEISHIEICSGGPQTPPPTTPPPTTEPPGTEPPGTEPPSTEPPSTEPPSEEPDDEETPKPVPTSVPAGFEADNGSASTIGLLAFVTALAVGGAALVTRRFLKDN